MAACKEETLSQISEQIHQHFNKLCYMQSERDEIASVVAKFECQCKKLSERIHCTADSTENDRQALRFELVGMEAKLNGVKDNLIQVNSEIHKLFETLTELFETHVDIIEREHTSL